MNNHFQFDNESKDVIMNTNASDKSVINSQMDTETAIIVENNKEKIRILENLRFMGQNLNSNLKTGPFVDRYCTNKTCLIIFLISMGGILMLVVNAFL